MIKKVLNNNSHIYLVRKQLIILLLLLLSSLSFAQKKDSIRAFVSNGVFLNDPKIFEVITALQGYLNSRPDSTYDNPYWNSNEKKKYTHFDLLRDYFSSDLYKMITSYKPTVMSISAEGDYYKIRTLYSGVSDSGFADPLAITEVYAKKVNGKYILYNAFPINTMKWQHHKIGHITFICPQYHKFNRSLAQKLNKFVDSIIYVMGEKPKDIDYYYGDTYDEIVHTIGYEYFMGEGNSKQAFGHAYVDNGYVIGGGADEWYPHEFIHMYAIPKYKNADGYFQEGLATLLGGSRNHSLNWHIKRVDSLFNARVDINIDSIFADPWSPDLDYYTGSIYVLGGLICKMAYEKDQWNGLNHLMQIDKGDNARFIALKELFGVERNDAGAFLRKKIREYATRIRGDVR
jgi:hypothetical protein